MRGVVRRRGAGDAVRRFIVGCSLFMVPLQAHATATLDCAADDKSVSFEAHSVVSHGLAEGFGNFSAVLSVKATGVPPDLAKLELDSAALAHHWLYRKELKLRLYHERAEGDHASVDMVIETRGKGEDGDFAGRYLLTIFQAGKDGASDKPLTFRGRVTCSVG